MSMKEITIGCENWSYEVQGSYTYIYDEDGESPLQLGWVATEGEIRAAAYGYGRGLKMGHKMGEASKMADIKKVLGIPVL